MRLSFNTVVTCRDFQCRKWPKLFRKLISNIDFTNEANWLPAKLRYRRRLRAGDGRAGWSDPGTENVREGGTPGQRWAVLGMAQDAGSGRGRVTGRPTDLVDNNGPGNDGAERGRREGSSGGHHRSLHAAAYF